MFEGILTSMKMRSICDVFDELRETLRALLIVRQRVNTWAQKAGRLPAFTGQHCHSQAAGLLSDFAHPLTGPPAGLSRPAFVIAASSEPGTSGDRITRQRG